MKTLLLFPPHWNPTQPYLSLPCLTAFLRSKGYDVLQRDLNVELFDRLLSRNNLADCFSELQQKLNRLSSRKHLDGGELDAIKRLFAVESKSMATIENIDRAKHLMRSDEGLDVGVFRECSSVIASGLDLIMAVYEDLVLTFGAYRDRWNPESSKDVLAAAAVNDNFLAFYYKKFFLEEILRLQPDVVGISISAIAQVIPGLTLARLIKEAEKGIHITIGGNHFSFLSDNLEHNNELFSVIDSLVVFEGELPMLRLLQCLEAGDSLRSVPSLLYRENGSVRYNRNREQVDITRLPPPTFEGFPLELYFTPEIVFPLQASRGCYWRKCKFCDYIHESASYRIKSAEGVLREIDGIPARKGKKYFHLVDSAPSIHFLADLSQRLADRKSDVHWATMCRFEKILEDPAVAAQLYQAGCRILEFGLESGSQKMLDMLQKGVEKTAIRRILANCKAAGICSIAFVMMGLPHETAEDAEQTAEFLEELGDSIQGISLNRFALKKHSAFGCEARDSGWSSDAEANGNDWANDSEFISDKNMSAEEFHDLYRKVKYMEQSKDLSRELRGTLWDVSYLLLRLDQEKRNQMRDKGHIQHASEA